MTGNRPIVDKNGQPIHMPIPKNLGKPGGPRFMDLLYFHLGLKIKAAMGEGTLLNQENLEDIYDMILQTIRPTFQKSQIPISEISCRFLAQRIFESIKISTKKIVASNDPEDWDFDTKNIRVYDRVDIKSLPAGDIRLIAGLFSDSKFANELREGIKHINNRA